MRLVLPGSGGSVLLLRFNVQVPDAVRPEEARGVAVPTEPHYFELLRGPFVQLHARSGWGLGLGVRVRGLI